MKIPNIDSIKAQNAQLGEALEAFGNAFDNFSQQLSTNHEGPTLAPTAHAAINVTAADGVHHVSVTDNSPRTRNVHNFVEYSDRPNFPVNRIQTIHLGVGRQQRIFIGNRPVYWRSYPQYPNGSRGPYTYFGSPTNPTAVHGGGTLAGPDLPNSTGSGTSNVGGEGFGREQFVSPPNTPGRPPKIF